MILNFQPTKILSLASSVEALHLPYMFGKKISPIILQAAQFAAHGIKGFDCSAYSRWLVYHAAAGYDIGDGSVEQYALLKRLGFASCPVADGHLCDGVVRIAVLDGGDQEGGEDHVMLLVNGSTVECYGHHGPGRRTWGTQTFMHDCELLVLGKAS